MSTFVAFVVANYGTILLAVIAVIASFILFLKSVIAICLMIPGPQPEATLQKIVDLSQKGVDFLTQFSRK